MKVMVTGASGFLGKALLKALKELKCNVVGTTRKLPRLNQSNDLIAVGDIDSDTDWSYALPEVDVIVHCAARVHVMHDKAKDPLAEFRKVNFFGTINLAEQAAKAGIKRFIFISSIKASGEETVYGKPFKPEDVPLPIDPYGISKLEAERALQALALRTGLEVVIIRPVLVYGEGVTANFEKMMSWLDRQIPLPFGAIHNKRSLVSLDNLMDMIIKCLDHPRAVGQIFYVSDGEDISTTELLLRVSKALNKRVILIPISVHLLKLLGRISGKRDVLQRLCGSLQVDISKNNELLGWTPPVKINESLQKTVKYFQNKK